MRRRTYWLLIPLFLTPPFTSRQEKDPLDSITVAELKNHIYCLASDSFGGRLTGSEGFKQASHYIASQLNAAGLAPVAGDSRGKGFYFQPIDFTISTISPESSLRIRESQREAALVSGDKFIPMLHSKAFKNGHYEGTAVFVGYGIEEPKDGWNDYESIDVRGKIAVMIAGAPTKGGKPLLSEGKNKFYGSLGQSAQKRMITAFLHRAEGIIIVADSATAKMWRQLASMMNKSTRRLVPDGKEGSGHFYPVFLLHPEAAGMLLKETGFDPVSGRGEAKPVPLKNTTLIFDLKYKIEREFACQNVVGFVPGSDPKLKDEFVVVGAHLDHLGIKNEGIFNGADDNASGCAAVLEVAEAIALSPPRRSLFFVFYTGEEGGGHGSFHFVDNFPSSLGKIALAINVDMVGRNCGRFPNHLLGISPDNLKLELAQFMEKANKNSVNVKLKTYFQEDDLGSSFGGSDEVVFYLRGIPVVLLTGGASHPDYHKVSDDPEKINYDKVADASRLVYALAAMAASAEKIP